MPTYLAIAYRWGWTNSHSYFVSCSSDLQKVLAAAEQAAEDRCGKYGVAVLEMPEDPASTPAKRLAYFPSSYGEAAPHANARHEAYGLLGQRVFNAVQHAKTRRTDEAGNRQFVAVDVPQWLREEAQDVADRTGISLTVGPAAPAPKNNDS